MKRSQVLIILFLFLVMFLFNINKYVSSSVVVYLIVNGISILTAFGIMFGNKKIESKIAWAILVLFVPVVGVLFYIILGIEYNRFKKFDPKVDVDKVISRVLQEDVEDTKKFEQQLGKWEKLVHYIENVGDFPLHLNTKSKILTNGPEKFECLKEELKKAKTFIHLEYFILKEGSLLNEITEILKEKAAEGVSIKILYDDFGCVDLSKNYLQELHDAGIKTACFNKIDFRLFRPSVNYRNHRKIVVIDNKVAFTGGVNIGDEYIHKDSYYGFWRDTHIMIEGNAARELNAIFIKDWYHTTSELLLESEYTEYHPIKNKHSAYQILADGPDTKIELIKDCFFKMIMLAKKRVWLTTPYLIPNSELIMALRVAAMSGIDVRILVPGKHDKGKKMVYRATEAYFSELLEAGVKIYTYSDLFMHSKVLIIDDEVASIGTVNFDYRSFGLHFEDTVILYEDPSIQKLIKDFEDDLLVSKCIILEEWKKRRYGRKMIESLMRIFSPLL